MMVKVAGVCPGDDEDAGVDARGEWGYSGSGVIAGDLHGAAFQSVEELRAQIAHERRLLGDRSVDHTAADHFERAIVAVHGDDLHLARAACLAGRGSRADAARRLDAADAAGGI